MDALLEIIKRKRLFELAHYIPKARLNAVLALLYEVVKEHLPDTTSSTVDLISSEYSFPCHIVDLRPDIIYWDETTKKVSLIELTVCFDTLFEGVPH